MTLARYPLDEFIHDMSDLVATEPDQATLFDRGSRPTISSYVLGKYDNC